MERRWEEILWYSYLKTQEKKDEEGEKEDEERE
jgi:hypothetical protein